MPDLFFRDTDPDQLRRDIVADVVAAIRPLLSKRSETPKRFANRAEMAELLGWSLAKLDRRTKDKAIPSMMNGDRRLYEIDAVIDTIKNGTPEAEAMATKRQADKQAAKRKEAASE